MKRSPATKEVSTIVAQHEVPTLSKEQREAIQVAEQSLTSSQKELIDSRMSLIKEHKAAPPSVGEGPSKDKGKGPDPTNWGAANLPVDEMDLEAQRREFEIYSANLKMLEDGERALSIEDQRNLLDFWNAHKNEHPTSFNPLKAPEKSVKIEETSVPEVNIAPASGIAATAAEPASAATEAKEPVVKIEPLTDNDALLLAEKPKKRKRDKTKARKSSKQASRVFSPGQALVKDALKGESESDEPKRKKSSRRSVVPSTQVEGRSYLGQVLISKGRRKRRGSPSSLDSSPSDSSSSEDDSDSPKLPRPAGPPGPLGPLDPSGPSDPSGPGDNLSDSGESSSRDSSDSLQSCHKGRRGRHRSRRRSNRKVPILKPEKPEKYNGDPDPEKFYKFATQAKEFIKGYRVKHAQVAQTIAHYLEGKAYNFYANTVSQKAYKWDLRKLLVGIFDYCFPLTFRMQQRAKLHNARQGDKTVCDFAHELENLIRMVGVMSKQERVDRLWFGLNSAIRIKLTEH